jgi:hypothetical protein
MGVGVRQNSISTCGCKDANARLDECCLWECGAVMFRRTSEKTRCPGGQNVVGLPRVMCRCATARDAGSARTSRLLHIDEEVALENVLPFFVLLGLFIRLVLASKSMGFVSRKGMMETDGQKACAHISSRVWSCTCSNRCLARYGCL